MSHVEALLLADQGDAPDIRAMDVLRRGIRRTPGVKRTLAFSAAVSLLAAVGRLALPVLIQQVIDRGLFGPAGYRPGLVLGLSSAAFSVAVIVSVLSPAAEIAMIRRAQENLYQLRRAAFEHVHRLSLAEQSRVSRGVLLARVTSDVETISRFMEWGAITWAMNVSVIMGAFVVMAVYSWQLALLGFGTMLGVVPAIRFLQVRQLRGFSLCRIAVGRLLSVFNETLAGGDTIRSYGYQPAARKRMQQAVDNRYRADLRTAKYSAALFTVGDLVSSVALVVVTLAAVEWGDGWGLSSGSVVSFFFLLALVQSPIGELTEVLDQTQAAVAGWDKVLTLLEREPELAEPTDPRPLSAGPLSVEAVGLIAGYDDVAVLHGIDVSIPAGSRVAVVGETGSGKTTFARVLCRLVEPLAGSVLLGGVELAHIGASDRRRSVRLVPQDGFLFDASVAENIRFGRGGAGDVDVDQALEDLGLTKWVSHLANGIETPVGPRGERLSVGERQLVALARAQVADPGLLVLDEATSSVDPETEQALAAALDRVARGRTVVSIAHRISTAEQADLVLVFDQGKLVEQGTHQNLVAAAGVYAALYASWRRATSES